MSGIVVGPGGPMFLQETVTGQGILANSLFVNETVPAPVPPSPPATDPNGVQGSGGGPPKKRRTLHLEGYRPEIVDPREYFAKREPPAVARAPAQPETERLPIVELDLPPLPDVPRRMPDALAARVEATITAAERKRALAELAADDEEAIVAILFAALT